MIARIKSAIRRTLRRSLKCDADDDRDIVYQRAGLGKDICVWRQRYLQSVTLPGLREALDDDLSHVIAEEECLYLPSDFSEEERRLYGLEKLATIERRVREREALLAIRNVKNACRQISFYDSKAQLYTRKTTVGTRQNTILHNARAHRAFWMDEYKTIRTLLVQLGMPDDNTMYRDLNDRDVWRPSTSMSAALGKGGEAPGWIWTIATGQSDGEEEEWIKEGTNYISCTSLVTNSHSRR